MLHSLKIPRAGFLLVVLLLAAASGTLAASAAENPATGDFWSDYEGRTLPEGGAPPVQETPIWMQTLRMLAGLAFILALIGGAAWMLRRYAARAETGTRTDVVRIIGNKMLGGRRSLLLVRVRGQTLLLGITPQSITFLTEIQELDGEWAHPPANPEKTASAFNRQLGAFIEEVVSETPATTKP